MFLLTFDDTRTALEDGSSSCQPACVGSLVCFVRSSSFFSGWVSEASLQVYQMDQFLKISLKFLNVLS
jgi:hypothetical protein